MKYRLVAVLVFIFCFTTLSYTGYGKPTTTVVKIGIGGARYCGGCGLISQSCPSGLKCCWGDVSPLIQVSPNTYQGLWIVGSSKFRYSECDRYGNCGCATLHFYKDPVLDCPPEMNMQCIDPEELNEVLVVTVPVVVMGSQAEQDLFDNPVPLGYLPPAEKGPYVYGVAVEPNHGGGGWAYKYNQVLYFMLDDGTGPQEMSVNFRTDKSRYTQEDTNAVLFIEIIDSEIGEFIEVDAISGEITLPDNTQKTLTAEEWVWNDTEKCYSYFWDFTNDDGTFSTPKEGFYSAEVTVKKCCYADVGASTTFGVCSHVEINLEFNKDIPLYSLGESVKIFVSVTDENGFGVDTGLESVLTLPDGTEVLLTWTLEDSGSYSTSFNPEQEGEYHIKVRVRDGIACYLEEDSATFYVKECEKAVLYLEISSDPILEELVEFVLTVTDGEGNLLPEAEIESEICIPGDPPYTIQLSWADQGDGTYMAEYTPSIPGHYKISGTVTVFRESNCFKDFFEGFFTVTERKLPDLVIRDEYITVEPDPHVGEIVTIKVKVQNRGEADAGEFYVLVLVTNEELGWVFIESKYVSNLPAGESILVEFLWKVKYSGKYIIRALADAGEEGFLWKKLLL